MSTRATAAVLFSCVLFTPALASSQFDSGDDRVPLGDLIEIVELADELLAVDATGGGTLAVSRRIGEQVLWRGTRGLLGVAITNYRILAVGTGAASWQELRYETGESPPSRALLGDRVALVELGGRVLGFLGPFNRYVEVRLGPNERLRATRVGANVAVVVTSRDAYGLSSAVGGFFPYDLQLREEVERIVAGSNVVTLHTDTRVLVFRSPTGTWAERRH